MKTDGRRIYTQSQGRQNDLVIELFEGEKLIPYCCKIMENNIIPGLLPVRHQILDGSYILKYNVSGKLRLQDYLMQRKLSYDQGLTLLRNLTDSLLRLEEFFLSAEQCILDPQQIYVGDGLRTYMICLPLEKENEGAEPEELKAFYEKLLSGYFATAECAEYDDMFKWVYRASPFDLTTLQKKFLSIPAEPQQTVEIPAQPAVFSMPPVDTQAVPEAAPKKQESAPAAPAQPARAGVLNIPGGGSFAMPTADTPGQENKKTKKDKRQKPEKEKKKKSFWPFGTHNEEAQLKPAPAVPPAPSAVPADGGAAEWPQQRPEPQNWERGTILVTGEQDGGTVFAGGVGNGCYLTYKGARVEVTTLPFVIGKYNTTKHLDYAIYNNDNISRQHASILMSEGVYVIRDEHSLNGTFVNGRRLMPDQLLPIKEGDEIRLYNEIFVFHLS